MPSYMVYYMILTWVLMVVVGFGCGAMCHFRKQYKAEKKRIVEAPAVDMDESPRAEEVCAKSKVYPSLSDMIPGMSGAHDIIQYNTGSKILSHDHTAQMHSYARSGPFNEALDMRASDFAKNDPVFEYPNLALHQRDSSLPLVNQSASDHLSAQSQTLKLK